MAEEYTPEQVDEAVFSHLVIMLAQNAAHMMGLLENPDGSRPPAQLEGAQMMIDMLELLERKTEGHRTDRESKFLAQTLTDLRMAYVQAAGGGAAAQPAGKKESAPAPQPAPAPEAAAEKEIVIPHGEHSPKADAQKPGADEEPPRFHKSYG